MPDPYLLELHLLCDAFARFIFPESLSTLEESKGEEQYIEEKTSGSPAIDGTTASEPMDTIPEKAPQSKTMSLTMCHDCFTEALSCQYSHRI